MVKKKKSADDFMHHLYVHMNDVDHFVIFSGMTLRQFVRSVEPVQNLLLLKHTYEEGSFNMHTQFDFINNEEMARFVRKENDTTKDLCWIDFVNERALNDLTPLEQAQLLYYSHKREPLIAPFSSKLQNRYLYYSSVDDKMTKVYFRFLRDAETLVSNLYNQMIKEKEGMGSFWRRKSKPTSPQIDAALLHTYRTYAKEGALLSIYKMDKPQSSYGVEIRTLSDYDFPDEVWDELDDILKQSYDEHIQIS